METLQKQQIANELIAMSAKLSQNKVAIKAGVSSATISQMINNNWDLIKVERWRSVQTALKIELNWIHAATSNYQLIHQLLTAAQDRSLSVAISFREGHSKSHSFKAYERMNENVIYVECQNYWTKKTFVQALLRAAGLKSDGTVGELIQTFIEHLQTLHKPIVIIDQADKLKDPQLDLFMDLYNALPGHCAFMLSGVPAFEKRILKGVQRDKIGYREMFSRIGRKFIALNKTSLQDVQAVCAANGCDDADFQIQVFNECDGDMRRVRRMVDQWFLTQKRAA
jgi:DNA transposition AAA+ family ATPase